VLAEKEMSHENEDGGVKGPEKMVVLLFKRFAPVTN
jgi:hypothetical protein